MALRLTGQLSDCVSRSPSLQWESVSHKAVTSTLVSAVPRGTLSEMCTPCQELKSLPRCHTSMLQNNKADFPHRGYS